MAAFKELIDIGEDIFTLHFQLYRGPTANLQAVGNDPALTTVLHGEPLPTDENKLITKVIPLEYLDFFNVFSCEEVKLMPPHHLYDHTIDLENDQMPPHSHIYLLSSTKLSTLCEFLDDMLGKGFIRLSSSPGGAPILFTKKKDGTLRLCINFWNLKRITRKDCYPILLVTNLINQLGSVNICTKFNL